MQYYRIERVVMGRALCVTLPQKYCPCSDPILTQEERGDGCLFRTALIRVHARNSDSDLLEDGIPEPEEVIDDPAIAHDTSSNYLTCSQSVTFSPTYQVPAFHFSIHHPGA